MNARWLGFGLSVLLATAAYAEPAATTDAPAETPAPATAPPAAPTEQADKPAKPEKAAKKQARKPDRKSAKKVDAEPETKPDTTADTKPDSAPDTKAAARNARKKGKSADKPADKARDAVAKAHTDEPRTTTVDKLPGQLKIVHVCAMPKATVEVDSERYARSVLFSISCTAEKGKLTPFAVYLARDNKGTAAKPVLFEGLKADGTPDKLEMLYSVTPAREAFSKDGDPVPNQNAKNDAIWLVGAWAPDDRPGVCAVSAQWRVDGEKGELFLWEEATECPKGALPKYEAKLDKKPPPLVGR